MHFSLGINFSLAIVTASSCPYKGCQPISNYPSHLCPQVFLCIICKITSTHNQLTCPQRTDVKMLGRILYSCQIHPSQI